MNSHRPMVNYISVLLVIVFIFSGCVFGDKVVPPQKIAGKANTFYLEKSKSGELITSVIVSDPPFTFCPEWKIISQKSIPIDNFIIKVGDVPDGFVQIVPDSNTRFIPKSNREYCIVILTNIISGDGKERWYSIMPMSTCWIAE